MCIKYVWETDMSLVALKFHSTQKKRIEKWTVINPYSFHCTTVTSNLSFLLSALLKLALEIMV